MSLLPDDLDSLKQKDEEICKKIMDAWEAGNIHNKDYSSFDDITDRYTARRVILLLLKEMENYKEMVENSLLSLQDMIKVSEKIMELESGDLSNGQKGSNS